MTEEEEWLFLSLEVRPGLLLLLLTVEVTELILDWMKGSEPVCVCVEGQDEDHL